MNTAKSPEEQNNIGAGVLADDTVKRNFSEALNWYKSGRSQTMQNAFDRMNQKHYMKTEIDQNGSLVQRLLPATERPTLRQFTYYVNKMLKYDYTALSENERQYDHINLCVTTCVDAVYVKSFIPEDNGNRFTEALPRPRNLEEAKLPYNLSLLSYDYEKERILPSEQRELMVYRLRDVRFPLPHQATLEQAVYNSLCLSYRARCRTKDAEMSDINLGNGLETGHSKLLGDSASTANAGSLCLAIPVVAKAPHCTICFPSIRR